MENPFNIAVRSDSNFENIISEITFAKKKFGLILSQEKSPNLFEISVFSFLNNSSELFTDTYKCEELMIDLDVFNRAISEAKRRLELLDIPR